VGLGQGAEPDAFSGKEPAVNTTRTLLTEHLFLEGLAPSSLDRLSAYAHPVFRNLGHRLFAAGRPAERFWLIRSGRVALDLHTPGRGDVVIETLEPGTVLGWSWLFPPRQWQFGAVTVEPVRAIEFNAAGVRHLMADDPLLGYELTRRFMAVMLDRLQATRTRLLDLYGYPEPRVT
jgi:CRP-like cAMP-binding protein